MRVRAAAGLLTLALLLQPVALAACACACLAAESDPSHLHVQGPVDPHTGCHEAALSSLRGNHGDGVGFTPAPEHCSHSPAGPATLRSGASTSGSHPGLSAGSNAPLASPGSTRDLRVRIGSAAESPPAVRTFTQLRI